MYEESKRVKGKIFLHPIIEWSDQDVWDYIQTKSLKYCSLYDEGAERIGCIMCPMQTPKGMKWDAQRYPKYYNAYLRAIRDIMKVNRFKWNTPEEMMRWWIYER
jgi:phosphoadenosine phosphosulfate reductase